MNFYLKTPRLGIRNLLDDDCHLIQRMREDDYVSRYQRWEDTSLSHIQEEIDEHACDILFSKKEIQRFAIAKSDGVFVGTLVLFYNEEEKCITIGITIDTPYQRQGFAREVLTALLCECQSCYPTFEAVALIHPDNVPSIRLFESIGFTFQLFAESLDSLVYVYPFK